MISASELRARARHSLSKDYWLAVGVSLIYALIIGGASFTYVGQLIFVGPLGVGLSLFFINLSRGKPGNISDLFEGFKKFLDNMVTGLLVLLFTFLWTLLFIIPGIVKGISYSMTYYILADEPTLSPTAAIDKSKAMMNGHKWRYFCLILSFIGWIILSAFTLGIGMIFLAPYMQAAEAEFYEHLKNYQN